MGKADKIFKEQRYYEESHNKDKILIYNQYNSILPNRSIVFFNRYI